MASSIDGSVVGVGVGGGSGGGGGGGGGGSVSIGGSLSGAASPSASAVSMTDVPMSVSSSSFSPGVRPQQPPPLQRTLSDLISGSPPRRGSNDANNKNNDGGVGGGGGVGAPVQATATLSSVVGGGVGGGGVSVGDNVDANMNIASSLASMSSALSPPRANTAAGAVSGASGSGGGSGGGVDLSLSSFVANRPSLAALVAPLPSLSSSLGLGSQPQVSLTSHALASAAPLLSQTSASYLFSSFLTADNAGSGFSAAAETEAQIDGILVQLVPMSAPDGGGNANGVGGGGVVDLGFPVFSADDALLGFWRYHDATASVYFVGRSACVAATMTSTTVTTSTTTEGAAATTCSEKWKAAQRAYVHNKFRRPTQSNNIGGVGGGNGNAAADTAAVTVLTLHTCVTVDRLREQTLLAFFSQQVADNFLQ
jgi:hypothetical protein